MKAKHSENQNNPAGAPPYAFELRRGRHGGAPLRINITIKEAISEGIAFLRQVSPSFGLDSEILLSEALKKPREYLLTHNEATLTFQQTAKYRHWLTQRYKGVPIPYLTGNAYFFRRKFIVNKYVLVPRPETEALVEETVKIVSDNTSVGADLCVRPREHHPTPLSCGVAGTEVLPYGKNPPVIADIGTGSGVIAVSLALEIPKAKIVATDKSGTALKVAARNAKKYRVQKRVTFFASDLLNEIPQELIPNIIVANLPYVTSDEIKYADEDADTIGLTFEPQGALDGGPDGLAIFRRFFAQIKRYPGLKEKLQHLLLEHSPKQYRPLCEMANEFLPNFKPTKVSEFVTHWK